MERIDFESQGVRLAAWRFRARGGDEFEGDAGRPCVVIAHGFGNTADSGLFQFGEAFAEAGLEAMVFDYRGFGASEGEPRQLVSYKRHREDYRAAVDLAREFDGVDPERIVLWGTSYSGGHVVAVAAEDSLIAAVISVVPSLDGAATLRKLVAHAGIGQLARMTAVGLRDRLASAFGRSPVLLPVAAAPGELGALTTPDALPGVEEIAGPTFRNEFCAREALVAANNRPIKVLAKLRCPVLFQIAEDDAIAPPEVVREAVESVGADEQVELSVYPGGHFDAYRGETCARIKADEIAFLSRELVAAQRATA